MMVVLNEQQESTIKKANISELFKLHTNHDNYHSNYIHTNRDDHNKIPLGIILGSTIAAIIVLASALVAYFLIARRKRKKKMESGWTKEAGVTSEDNASLNDTTSSLVVEYVEQTTRSMDEATEGHGHHSHPAVVNNNGDKSNRASTSPSPNQDESDSELISPHTSSPQATSTSSASASEPPPQPMPPESSSHPSQAQPTVTIISPQPTDSPRESSETASGSFDRPPWNRNSRFQEFF